MFYGMYCCTDQQYHLRHQNKHLTDFPSSYVESLLMPLSFTKFLKHYCKIHCLDLPIFYLAFFLNYLKFLEMH